MNISFSTYQKKKLNEIIEKEWRKFLFNGMPWLIIQDKIEETQRMAGLSLQWILESCRAVFDSAYVSSMVRACNGIANVMKNEDRVRLILTGFKLGESVQTLFVFSSERDAQEFIIKNPDYIFDAEIPQRMIVQNFAASPEMLIEYMPEVMQ